MAIQVQSPEILKRALAASGGASLVKSVGGLDLATLLASFKNARELGAAADGSLDSVALQNIFSNEEYIFFPAGIYKADQLTLVTGQTVVCARGAVFEASDLLTPIFDTTGVLHEIDWTGGQFQNCLQAFRHTGNSAFAYSTFRNARFNDLQDGFELSSAVGIDWDNCWFGVNGGANNIARGIHLTGTGSGQTNINTVNKCKFLLFQEAGLFIADSANVKIGNSIKQSWFEDSDGYGIYLGGNSKSTTIETSYFETCGDATHQDIRVNAASGAVLNTTIENNTMQTPNASQLERIKLTGNTDARIRDNDARILAGQVMVDISSAGGAFHTAMNNNYLNVTSGTDYETALYRKSGTQQVSWSAYVGSGGVTDDEYPMEVFNGVKTGNWGQFSNADATPSVRAANRFKTAGTTTITNFDDGRDGQEITIKAGNTITVLGVEMVLGDVAKFINDGGTWRSVNK